MIPTLTLNEITALVGGRLEGAADGAITGVASLEEAAPHHVTFVLDEKRFAQLAQSKAGAALVADDAPKADLPLIRVANVQAALAKLLERLGPGDDLPPAGIDPRAIIDPTAAIGEGVAIAAGAVVAKGATIGRGSVLCANVQIGANVTVGENTILFEGVVVRWGCSVGSRCRIGPNSVLGFDGFGYYFAGGKHNRIAHIGSVEIGDDVDLGACTCVDRGKFGVTRVGPGTKIDNMVQVAHNVQVGANCVIAAQAGLAGSARVGDYSALGGGVGIRDNISLGRQVQCAAFSAVAGDLEDGAVVAGIPAGPVREKFRELQALTKLPDLLKQVRNLQSRLEKLESSTDH